MKTIKLITALLFILTASSLAQNINGRFSSSLYAFERYDTTDVSNIHSRAYQLLSLNLNYEKVSIRSYMNLETDLSKELADDPRLRFYNLYLEARSLFDIATIKIGRQPIFNSVAGGIFDGANLDIKYNKFKLNGFYGLSTPAYQKLELIDDKNDNTLFGGKISTTILPDFRFAFGYINKNFKPQDYWARRLDSDLNPIQVLISNKSNQYEYLTGEAGYEMKDIFSIDTKYEYDLNFEKTSVVEAFGSFNQLEDINFNIYYSHREPRIRYNSIFSVFDYGNTQEIEAGADYKINSRFTLIGKFANVTFRDDNSQRITAGVNSSLGTLTYRKTLGYAGELDAVSLYTARTFLDGLVTPSIGISFTNYKLNADDEKNNLTTVLAGVNYRPVREFSVDVQGQFLNNKIYKNDYRLFVKLNYWFNTNLNLF